MPRTPARLMVMLDFLYKQVLAGCSTAEVPGLHISDRKASTEQRVLSVHIDERNSRAEEGVDKNCSQN